MPFGPQNYHFLVLTRGLGGRKRVAGREQGLSPWRNGAKMGVFGANSSVSWKNPERGMKMAAFAAIYRFSFATKQSKNDSGDGAEREKQLLCQLR